MLRLTSPTALIGRHAIAAFDSFGLFLLSFFLAMRTIYDYTATYVWFLITLNVHVQYAESIGHHHMDFI
jgi:hypothetical protein